MQLLAPLHIDKYQGQTFKDLWTMRNLGIERLLNSSHEWPLILLSLSSGLVHYELKFCPPKKNSLNITQLQATTMIGLASYVHRCNNGMNVIGVTNYFLIGSKVHSIRWNQYLTSLKGPKTCGYINHKP